LRPLPIRIKLTAWYIAVLTVTFCAFGAIAFFAMRKSIEATVDEDLRGRAKGIQELMERALPKGQERLADVLREHSEIRQEVDLSQVSDAGGHWIYRTPRIKRYDIPVSTKASAPISIFEAEDMHFRVLTTEASLGGQIYRVQVAALMDDFYDALEHFQWVVLLSSPLLLLFASAGGYWMSRRALAPVDEITRTAQTISSKNLSSRLSVPQSRDELQRLSETLNGMLDRLEATFKRITQFTADASHELRTPVALMRTTAELSLRRPRNEAEYRDALSQISGELVNTSTLIEKLMIMARADSGVETLQRVPVDLSANLREACDDGRTLAASKQVTLQEEISSEPIIVEGDSHALQRLFLILIDNAVKYTPAQGQIVVSLSGANGFAVAEVRDTGIGIDQADLPHIFERFYRADKARSRELGGVGLGLSIGRWIAEAHEGVIEVESTLGHGSVFRVRLPRAGRSV
jgi:heavy metal sensor kinase